MSETDNAGENPRENKNEADSTTTSLSWKIMGGAPSRSRLCNFDQDFTSVAFLDDGEDLRNFDADLGVFVYYPSGDICPGQEDYQGDNQHNNNDDNKGQSRSLRPWEGKRSRVLVGSAKGDIYLFYQPRRLQSGTRQPHPWWEEASETLITNAYSLKWNATARVVFVLPRSVEVGNRILLQPKQQEELERTRLEIKRRAARRGSPSSLSSAQSMDELVRHENSLQYSGPLGHSGAITAMASQRDEEEIRVVTCGADMELRVWRVMMRSQPQIKGIDGALRSSPGSHEFLLVKKKINV